jgi:hypothetical protein
MYMRPKSPRKAAAMTGRTGALGTGGGRCVCMVGGGLDGCVGAHRMVWCFYSPPPLFPHPHHPHIHVHRPQPARSSSSVRTLGFGEGGGEHGVSSTCDGACHAIVVVVFNVVVVFRWIIISLFFGGGGEWAGFRRACMYMYLFIHIYIHTDTHLYTHIYIHLQSTHKRITTHRGCKPQRWS